MKTTLSQSERETPLLIYFFILILPFLLFYWQMPFASNSIIGQDFRDSILQHQEILFSIKTGSFPLYNPGYQLGQSSIVLTWSQVFHPISHLSSIMPGYWNGKAFQWYVFYNLLSLGLTQLVLFVFLRNLQLNMVFSFLISLITVYNLRMLDLFRYGASLQAYTGHLLLCAAIGWNFIRPSKIFGPLSIITATYLLVVSGHPQFMYYGLLADGLFMLIGPFFISNLFSQSINIKEAIKFWLKTGFFILLGILLASVYIFPFLFDFYPTNIGRADTSQTSIAASISSLEILNNLFLPFYSDVNQQFGGSSLIIVGILTPFLLFFKIKLARFVWFIWGILIFVFLFMLGDTTPVYNFVWKNFPFMSTFRHQGKFSTMLPILFMMLLVWTVKIKQYPLGFKGLFNKIPPYSILALISALIIPLYLFLYMLLQHYIGINFDGSIHPASFNNISKKTIILTILIGEVSLIGLFFYGINRKASRVIGVLLLLTTIIQVGILLRYGTFILPVKDSKTFEQIKAQKKKRLDYRTNHIDGLTHYSVITQLDHSFIEPYFGKIYFQIIPVVDHIDAYDRMMKERLPQQLFIEGYSSGKAKAITENTKGREGGTVELIYSSFNRMQFRAVSNSPAFFGFSYPYMDQWRAWVNNKNVHIYKANGMAQAVEIPEGESIVEFRYWSDAYLWGIIVSLVTFAAISFFICLNALNGLPRYISMFLLFIMSVGGFFLWYNSLYSGENFETEYNWTYTPVLKTPNFAYGKKTLGYNPPFGMLYLHSSKAVDGYNKPGFGLILHPHHEPLIIDLYKKREIKKIILYGELKTLPEISLSEDNVQWQKVTPVASGVPLRIIFEKPQVARFVKVKASKSELVIDELEIYGTDKDQYNP